MTEDQQANFSYLFQLAAAPWMSRALWAAAHFKLADQIGEDAAGAGISEIAARTGTLPDRLSRVLKALASLGIFEQLGNERFVNNARSRLLCSDDPASMRAFIDCMGGGEVYESLGCFGAALTQPVSGFKARHGVEIFEYYQQHPLEAQRFAQAMANNTRPVEAAVAAHDFPPFDCVVDVGGSHGNLMRQVVAARPGVRGVLFDLPHVTAHAEALWRDDPNVARFRAVGGNFFDEVCPGGDLYLLKLVLHDWADDSCMIILSNVRKAMQMGGRLAIVEMVLPDDGSAHPGWGVDLLMMSASDGGRERSRAEYLALLEATGFVLRKLTPVHNGVCLIEAVAAAEAGSNG